MTNKTNKDQRADVPASEFYGNKVRARVCGICTRGDEILLVNHGRLYGYDFWAPPGGGIEFGQSATASLVREFREETGLEIRVGQLKFVCEFIGEPLHAVELFFGAEVTGGSMATGSDPELGGAEQHITDVKYMSWKHLKTLPEKHLHGALVRALSTKGIDSLAGYLRI